MLYSIDDPTKGKINFIDRKRHLWLLSLIIPGIPLIAIPLYFITNHQWVLTTPLLIMYLIVPILDLLIGEDNNNPPEELVPQIEKDSYYRIITIATVPMHFIVLISIAWLIATEPLHPLIIFILALIAGGYSGFAINTAHELGHKNTRLEKWLAKILLAVPAYGHFSIEHNRGHHTWVSTPEDHSSSRMGESIYSFGIREVKGTVRRAIELEKKRLENKKKGFWSVENDILQSYLLSLVLQLGLIYFFGWIMIPFLLIHNFWAWFVLTSANYIEHYGLLREKNSKGRYERCQPHHSWNSNFIFSNLMLFNLQRHSDHHANPARRYQSLRNFDDIPQMPIGYHGMYMLAYIPPLWFKIMDKKLLELPHINGDLSKVNVHRKRDPINLKRVINQIRNKFSLINLR